MKRSYGGIMRTVVVLMVCMALLVGVANAAPTTVENTVTNTPTFDKDHWGYEGSLNWLHQVDYGPLPDPLATLDIQSAALRIRAYSVESTAAITGDGTALGSLT